MHVTCAAGERSPHLDADYAPVLAAEPCAQRRL